MYARHIADLMISEVQLLVVLETDNKVHTDVEHIAVVLTQFCNHQGCKLLSLSNVNWKTCLYTCRARTNLTYKQPILTEIRNDPLRPEDNRSILTIISPVIFAEPGPGRLNTSLTTQVIFL
jgi:hypothetical protein